MRRVWKYAVNYVFALSLLPFIVLGIVAAMMKTGYGIGKKAVLGLAKWCDLSK